MPINFISRNSLRFVSAQGFGPDLNLWPSFDILMKWFLSIALTEFSFEKGLAEQGVDIAWQVSLEVHSLVGKLYIFRGLAGDAIQSRSRHCRQFVLSLQFVLSIQLHATFHSNGFTPGRAANVGSTHASPRCCLVTSACISTALKLVHCFVWR